jgi:cyclomaltodextrinase
VDFAFGTYINDALKIANHRAVHMGIQHLNNITPVDPAPCDPVTVMITTSGDSGVTQAALYFTTDESVPQGSRGTAQHGQAVRFERTHTTWNSIIWDYVTHWQAVIPAQPDHTLVQYTISGWTDDDGTEIYADWPNPQERVQHEAMLYFKNIPEDSVFSPGVAAMPQVFNYHVDTIQPPQWARNAVIYQVFLDRFYPGDGKSWQQTDDFNDFFGGTLWGVCDKLDYLADLGINCIWLSPTWVSPSYHGYDVADYDRVEPRLGGEEALRAVISGAHQRGIRVLLDMVCNHLSNEHPFFIDAHQNEASPYRDWFFFGDEYEYGYKGFFNAATMPELNLAHPAARDWMVNNAIHWLQDFAVDGYRLDYANGPGPDFWTHFRRACKAVNPDCLIFGEIIEPANILRQYIGRLDGCLDFSLNDALRRTFGWQTWDQTHLNTFTATHRGYLDGSFVRPIFLDNHDMDRFSYIADNDSERIKQAIDFQFQTQHPIIIQYGNEIGLGQTLGTGEHGLDVCRTPMLWDKSQKQELYEFYKRHIIARTKQDIQA